MTPISASELITHPDGSVFHLHLRPEELADRVILVGDPGRVESVAGYFDTIETEKQSREFRTITGYYRGTRITVLSTGIGADNIDIVMNELDALVNIDLATKTIRPKPRSLQMVRIGTCGSLQADLPVGTFALSEWNIGLDGVLRFYHGHQRVCLPDLEEAFIRQCRWTPLAARPYGVAGSPGLVERLHTPGKTVPGITLTANGFYGPQGRTLRLPIEMPQMNRRIEAFRFEGRKIINFEMESAAIAGLAAMMGHQATTLCLAIANRATGEALPDYREGMHSLIQYTLDKLIR